MSRPARPIVRLLIAALCLASAPASADDRELGELAYHRGDYAYAAELWRPLAEAGDPFAQFGMGLLYYRGDGVEADATESTRWFRLSAEQGYGPAQFNLGNAYKHGHGVPVDEAAAVRWWRPAAEQDYAAAQYNLALQYHFGLGVAQDDARAGVWLRRAAENGHADAIALLASAIDQDAESTADPPPRPPAAIEDPGSARAWIRAQDPAAFTLQLFASRNEDAVRALLDRNDLPGPVAYFPFERDGGRWFALIHGVYPTRSAANAATQALPAMLRAGPPWVRTFGEIHALLDGG